MTIYWLALAAAISTSLIGQILLKSGASSSVAAEGSFFDQLFRLPTMVGLVCYGGAALLYIIALRRIPMSVALPCTAASYIVIAIIGWAVFGEALGLQKIAAIGLIAAGVALLATTASGQRLALCCCWRVAPQPHRPAPPAPGQPPSRKPISGGM